MWRRHGIMMAKAAVSGTAVILGSSTISCVLALYIERTAHRVLFTYFPAWYKDVEQANGIESWELDAVRNYNTNGMRPQQGLPGACEGLPWEPALEPLRLSEQNVLSCAMTS